MNLWTPITHSHIDTVLTSAQRETLSTRPHQGTDQDALTLSIGSATQDLRQAIRQHPLNELSSDEASVPSDLVSTTVTLCIAKLSEHVPGFALSESQLYQMDAAQDRLRDIASGEVPITRPLEPMPSPARRTVGVSIIGSRTDRISQHRLAGL